MTFRKITTPSIQYLKSEKAYEYNNGTAGSVKYEMLVFFVEFKILTSFYTIFLFYAIINRIYKLPIIGLQRFYRECGPTDKHKYHQITFI